MLCNYQVVCPHYRTVWYDDTQGEYEPEKIRWVAQCCDVRAKYNHTFSIMCCFSVHDCGLFLDPQAEQANIRNTVKCEPLFCVRKHSTAGECGLQWHPLGECTMEKLEGCLLCVHVWRKLVGLMLLPMC